MSLKIVLNNGDEIGITDYTSTSFIAEGKTFLEAVNDFETMSRSTGTVQVENEEETVMNAEGVTFDGMQVMQNQTGSYTAFYYYHGAKAAETEKDEFATIGKILMGVEL